MLPFTKRPRDEAEFLNSGDVEVVRAPSSAPPASHTATRRQSAFPAPPSDRPRVFHRSVGDDEMTSVMSQKAKSSFPSAGAPRSSSRPRAGVRQDSGVDEERTMMRDTGSRSARGLNQTQSSVRMPPRSAPPAAFSRTHSSRPAPSPNQFGIQTPPTLVAPPGAIPSELRDYATAQMAQQASPFSHPSSMLPPAGPDSSAGFVAMHDPPATVITTRTRVLARPTVSWAAALVAMGVFVGLVTAVVARGDADSLIDATASFVDPSHARASAAASQIPGPVVASVAGNGSPAPVLPPVFAPVASTPAPIAPLTAGIPVTPAVKATQDLPIANPTTEKRAPVAYVAPSKPVSELPLAKPEPKPAPRHVTSPRRAPASTNDAVAAAPAPAPKAVSRPSKATPKGNDDDGAAKAAELADEQLKAALR